MQPWQKVLQSVGYPTKALVIDFESYFSDDYTLFELSDDEYVNDERFEFTGVGLSLIDDRGYATHFVPGPLVIDYLSKLDFSEYTVVMQKASFDAMIMRDKLGTIPPYIIDLKDLLNHLESRASSKLKDAAPRFGFEDKGNTLTFKGLHWDEMDEVMRCGLRDYTEQDAKLEGQLFTKLLPMITNPTTEIPLMRLTLDLKLESDIHFDFDLALELLDKMDVILQEKIQATGCTQEELSGNLSFVELMQNALPNGEHVPTKAAKRPGKKMTALLGAPGIGPAFAKDDPGTKALLLHPTDEVRALMQARLNVKSWPTHIGRIRKMLLVSSANPKKRIPIATTYAGAHTHRWTGTDGYNVLNLGSRSHPLVNQVRNLLIAPEGYKFVINDWKQVEARFLAWMAGQDDLVADFALNKDIYSIFASELFGCRVRQTTDDDPDAIKAFLGPKRHMGKETILGGGYGMGWAKFFERMASNATLKRMIITGKYTKKTAKDAIYGYRNMYPKIPALWKELEKGFKWVIKCPKDVTYEWPKGFSVSSVGSMVTINFPTGRKMFYPECRIKHGSKGDSIGWKYGYLWGGSLAENVTQSACRDIMVEKWLACNAAGIKICFQLYDELAALVPTPRVARVNEKMVEIMTATPAWAEGCPLGVDGKVSKCYTK